ncbi:putative ceramidase [Helianthus debilis subsp. tardiflorus]
MADGISSFWGPVTSSHEWCEKNYVVSSYVAEFYNTISTIPCILLADGISSFLLLWGPVTSSHVSVFFAFFNFLIMFFQIHNFFSYRIVDVIQS